MIIGIDGNEANITKRVGINKYAYEIIKSIHAILPNNKDLIVIIYLKENPLSDMPKETPQFKYKILNGRKIWIMSKLTPYLLTNPEKIDVFFSPNHYIPPFSRVSMVCAIMDLGFLKNSEQFTKYDFWQLKYWTAWSIKRSKYVLTISNASKEDIVRQYPNSSNKIIVTYPGYDKYLTTQKISATKIRKVCKKYSIVGNYILYIGTLKPSKNLEGLIRAYKSAVADINNIKLVIAGKKGWLYDSIFGLVKDLGIEKDIVFTDFISDEDKLHLIKGAKAFILPSFWEGFGLDILTCFTLGVPVVASNVGSIPEVLGDAGILIDPYRIESIASGIKKVLSLKRKDYNKIVSKGKLRLKVFSWENAAKLTIETLRKAANVS